MTPRSWPFLLLDETIIVVTTGMEREMLASPSDIILVACSKKVNILQTFSMPILSLITPHPGLDNLQLQAQELVSDVAPFAVCKTCYFELIFLHLILNISCKNFLWGIQFLRYRDCGILEWNPVPFPIPSRTRIPSRYRFLRDTGWGLHAAAGEYIL